MQIGAESLSLTLAVALAAGVICQLVAQHLRLPGIVLLLAVGALLGPEVAGLVDPDALGDSLFTLVDFGVALILFEGGLNLDMSRLRRQESSIRRLVTIGALVTLVGAFAAAHWVLDWPWQHALLFGSLVVVTGPTVVTPLLRDLRLRPRIKTILEAEGVLIDPIGAILAVLVLETVLVPFTETVAIEAWYLIVRLSFGAAAGLLGGWVIGRIVRSRTILPEGFGNIFTLGCVILLFSLCDLVIKHSGIIAVTACGIVVGNLHSPVDRDLREFKDQITIMMVGLLFVLLAADVNLQDVTSLGFKGLLVVGLLVLVVRPFGAWLCTRGAKLTWQERLFIAWIAPRGIVAAAIAALTAAAMKEEGMEGGQDLRAIVFLTIGTTVILAGLTARPVAGILGLRLPGRDRVAILGAQGLGLAMAAQLRRAGVHVVFIDSDRQRCRDAHDAGFQVVRGDALKQRTLLGANMELVGIAIGLTQNSHLNSIFVRQAREIFGVPNGFVALDSAEGETPEHIQRYEGQVLFGGPHDVECWDVRWRQDEVIVERLGWSPPADQQDDATKGEEPTARPLHQERWTILTIARDGRVMPMTLDQKPKAGDVAAVAVNAPQRDEALEALASMGWSEPVPDEEEQP